MENERKEIIKNNSDEFKENNNINNNQIENIEHQKIVRKNQKFNYDYSLIIILFLFYLSLSYFKQRKLFLNISFILSIIIPFNKIICTYKSNSNKNKFIFTLKIIITIIFIHFFIKENNPFFILFFFYLPFINFFKSLLMIILFSYIIDREYKKINNTLNNYLFEDIFKSFNKNKTKILTFLIIIKISIFLYKDQFSHNFLDKTKLQSQKYYIAANLFNNENIIDDWTVEMTKLINYLGRDNCYISIYENGDSTDETPKKLKEFESKLNKMGVKNRINTEKIIPKGIYERIQFLTLLRNKALEFLYEIPNLNFNHTKVLFFNDIIFSYKDILKLISTNDMNYDLACGLDFYESFYDTWVSIGIDGQYFRYYFPYFMNKIAIDRILNEENIRVYSCWNGVVSINGKAFEDKKLEFRYPIKLRQSECILLVTDLWTMNFNKIILNPNIKFAYEYFYYYLNKYFFDWTWNVITYFYYYFVYWNVEDNFNFANVFDNNVELDKNWLLVMNYYLKK